MPHKTISGSATLSTAEAAKYVGLAKSTLEKMRVYGGGPPFLTLGGSTVVRYLIEDLDAWMVARRSASTSERDR